jgi:hypothetical protein
VNQPVYDLSGNLLGVADLLDPDAGLVTEFDGQQHRERAQRRADNVREERLEAAGSLPPDLASTWCQQAPLGDRNSPNAGEGV